MAFFCVPVDGGRCYEWQNDSIRVLLTGADTCGAFTLVEDTLKSSFVLPMHVHHHHTETFHILEGAVEFTIGNEVVITRQGMTLHVPRGMPHAVKAVPGHPAKQLMVYEPAGFEKYLERLAGLRDEEFADAALMRALDEEFDQPQVSPAEMPGLLAKANAGSVLGGVKAASVEGLFGTPSKLVQQL